MEIVYLFFTLNTPPHLSFRYCSDFLNIFWRSSIINGGCFFKVTCGAINHDETKGVGVKNPATQYGRVTGDFHDDGGAHLFLYQYMHPRSFLRQRRK